MGIHIMPPLYEMVIKPKLALQDYCHAVGDKKVINYSTSYYQSFIPTKSYKITKVVLTLRRDISPDFTGWWVKFIFREAFPDGKPKEDDLYTKSLPWEDLPTSFGEVEVVFDTPVTLAKDQPYCISCGWGGPSRYGALAYWSYDSTLSCGLALWTWDLLWLPYWFLQDGSVWFEVWGQGI